MFLQWNELTSCWFTVGANVCRLEKNKLILQCHSEVIQKMAILRQALLVVTTATMVLGQRPSFAGFRPIGIPEISTISAAPATDELGNRFGEDDNTTSTTTQRLPIEANGDKNLVDRLSKLPIDKQPFWFINWQAIEANRNKPQTYPQRPSHFAPVQPTYPEGTNTAEEQSPGNTNLNTGLGDSIRIEGSSGNVNSNSESSGSNSDNFEKNLNSGTRDVDVTSFLSNRNDFLGTPNLPEGGSSSSEFNKDVKNQFNSAPGGTLNNRNVNNPSIYNSGDRDYASYTFLPSRNPPLFFNH